MSYNIEKYAIKKRTTIQKINKLNEIKNLVSNQDVKNKIENLVYYFFIR